MKTDREMTESLLKRRDEYNSAKLRKGAYLRLIPKIGVPVCAAVAVVTVLSLNKNIFTGGSESGKDINLVSAATQNALLTDKDYPYEIIDQEKVSTNENRGYSTEELVSEAIKNNPEIIVQEGVGIPQKIILDKVIYSYIDLYTFSVREEEGKDMFDDAIFYPAGSVMFEVPSEDGGYTSFLSCTAFDMIGAEDFVAIVINGGTQIYAKAGSARFETENITFEAETPLTKFSKFERSKEIFYEDDEYTIFNAVDKSSGDVLKDIWIVYDHDSDYSEGYLCFSSYQTVQELSTDGYGKVMDTSDVILNHFFKNGSDNYYNIVGSLWYNYGQIEKIESLSYLGKTYERVSSENYDNATLHQLRNIDINGNTYTLFEVNGRSDTAAIIENGDLSYFRHTYEIQISDTIEPISTEELWVLTEELKSNYFSVDSITPESINTYYDSGYNAQFYYKGDGEEQYAVVVAVDGPNGADRLTIADMNSEKRVDIFIGVDNIDDYIYFDGDKVKIDFDKQ